MLPNDTVYCIACGARIAYYAATRDEWEDEFYCRFCQHLCPERCVACGVELTPGEFDTMTCTACEQAKGVDHVDVSAVAVALDADAV